MSAAFDLPALLLRLSLDYNGVWKTLKYHRALRHKLGLSPVQLQCRFRTIANLVYLFYSCFTYIWLLINCPKMGRVSVNQLISHLVRDYVNRCSYFNFMAQVASQRHLPIGLDLCNPIAYSGVNRAVAKEVRSRGVKVSLFTHCYTILYASCCFTS